MKAILVGLGSAGFGWYQRLLEKGLLAAVVEIDPAMKEKVGDDPFPFFTSLEQALDTVEANFLVNVTSPMMHTKVNAAAFDRGLAVLCEKPISFDYLESIDIVARAQRERIPFMIAENYRRMPFVRKVKGLIDSGAIGAVSSLDIQFYRYHHVQRRYTVSLLDDIGVHHFDMIRYLSGSEGASIQAKLFNPLNGWEEEEGASLSASVIMELENGITASYRASIASSGTETPWSGNWRIEGTEGAIEVVNKEVRLIRGGAAVGIEDFSDVDVSDTLEEFLNSLREGRESETSAGDYLKTQALVHYAKLASDARRQQTIVVPH